MIFNISEPLKIFFTIWTAGSIFPAFLRSFTSFLVYITPSEQMIFDPSIAIAISCCSGSENLYLYVLWSFGMISPVWVVYTIKVFDMLSFYQIKKQLETLMVFSKHFYSFDFLSFLRSFFFRNFASFAILVVLPEP